MQNDWKKRRARQKILIHGNNNAIIEERTKFADARQWPKRSFICILRTCLSQDTQTVDRLTFRALAQTSFSIFIAEGR